MPWRKILIRVASDAETFFDQQKHRLDMRLRRFDPVQIVPYRGYGTPRSLHLKGRVLEQHAPDSSGDKESIWTNILQMYRRFESDEVTGIKIEAAYNGQIIETVTDDEGYFEIVIEQEELLSAEMAWYEVDLRLVESPQKLPVVATGEVLIPSAQSSFGVISDVDDTIIITNAASFFKMAWLTFINSARTRLPFKGVAAFYRALSRGTGHANPIFYLSSSPWNLYDLLVDFMEIHEIPRGPLLLRDLGIDKEKFITSGHFAHKRGQIDRLLRTYPSLSFILIGDSGQHDPEIFETVVEDYPDRILAIYIRDVSSEQRDEAIRVIASRLSEKGVEMLLIPDTRAAAKHAAAMGFILPEALVEVEKEYNQDSARPDELERTLDRESLMAS